MRKGMRRILLFIGREAWLLKQHDQPREARRNDMIEIHQIGPCVNQKKKKKRRSDNRQHKDKGPTKKGVLRNKYSSSLSCHPNHIRNYKNWAISNSSIVSSKARNVVLI